MVTIIAMIEPFAKISLVDNFLEFLSFNENFHYLLVIKTKDTLYLVKPKLDSWQVIKDSIQMSSH